MGHCTLNSNKKEYRKKLGKITAKSKKKAKTIAKDRCFRFQN